MRHFFAARPVAALSRGVAASPRLTILVALSGELDRAAPGLPGTVSGTINLAAVAAAANQRLGPAFRADEQSRRRDLVATGQVNTAWTAAVVGVILTPHACPARCEGTAPNRTARLRSAPCLFLQKVRLLRRHPPPCQNTAAQAAHINSPKRQVVSAPRGAPANCQIAG